MSLLRVFSHDRPIVLLLDDAQWADAATLSVLRYLLKTLTTERVLVVVAYRTEDTGRTHPLGVSAPTAVRHWAFDSTR